MLEQWLRSCKTLEFNTGDIVITQGEANPSVYLLVEGALTVHITSERSTSVAMLRPGDIAGEVSALSGRETSAWVTATTTSRAIEVPTTLLLEWASPCTCFNCPIQDCTIPTLSAARFTTVLKP